MATNTSRTKLRRPQKGVGGTANDPITLPIDWNNSLDIIDDGLGIPSVTSLTHSLNPFDGKIEFETDTNLYAIWDTSRVDWVPFPGDSQEKGFMVESVRTAFASVQALADGEMLQPLTATFNAEAGRRYWVEFILYVRPTAGTIPFSVVPRLRWNTGPTTSVAGVQLGGNYNLNMVHAINQSEHTHRIYEWVPGVTQQVTCGITLEVTSGGATSRMQLHGDSTHTNWLMVRDVGI